MFVLFCHANPKSKGKASPLLCIKTLDGFQKTKYLFCAGILPTSPQCNRDASSRSLFFAERSRSLR